MGQPSHKAGAFTGVFNVLANLTAARDYDPYANMTIPNNIDKVNHNIDPKHVRIRSQLLNSLMSLILVHYQ